MNDIDQSVKTEESAVIKRRRRDVVCPQCGSIVRIPIYWVIGIEGIFRCKECRLPFKTGYKMGAVLFALGLTLSIVTVQILVYIFSSYSIGLFALLVIPLWIYFAFFMRKWYMRRRTYRAYKKSRVVDMTLPKDVSFDEDLDEEAQ